MLAWKGEWQQQKWLLILKLNSFRYKAVDNVAIVDNAIAVDDDCSYLEFFF